jgi:hypothetical protein
MSERITIIDFVDKYTKMYSQDTFIREKLNGKWEETSFENTRSIQSENNFSILM